MKQNELKPIRFIKNDFILFAFFILFVILTMLFPWQIAKYSSFVDWRTIATLAGLLMITTGLKESEYFNLFSRKILEKLKDERNLAIFLISISIIFSTFLTNDVTLFIVVPLTLSFQNIIKSDFSKLIIFEAISVNAGSALTPIGNPQNIFLWHKWGISFIAFMIKMIPLVAVLIAILLIFALIFFKSKKIEFLDKINENGVRRNLFISSITMFVIYIVSLQLKQFYFILPFIFLFYLIFYRKDVLPKVDWLLLLLFIIIFIDFRVLSSIPVIYGGIHKLLELEHTKSVFLFSAFISQLISNVPASVFVSKFSNCWLGITYGVNIGGNGLAIASLANVIALRMAKNKKIWIDFHKYSIPYFLITLIIIYAFFVI